MILAIDSYDWVSGIWSPVDCRFSCRDIAQAVGLVNAHATDYIGLGEMEFIILEPVKIHKRIVFEPYDKSYGHEWRSSRLQVRVMTIDPQNSLNAR